MTLIVGIKCTDGIVMCGDGALTSTIRQSSRKLSIIQPDILVGFAGALGLAQRQTGLMSRVLTTENARQQIAGWSLDQAMGELRVLFWPAIEQEMKIAASALAEVAQVALNSAIVELMVALPCGNVPQLMRFNTAAAPEACTDMLDCFAIGSGRMMADPFLAFLKDSLYNGNPLSLADGRFIATLTMRHAIRTNPGGIADPIQMVVLESQGAGGFSARELEQSELDEHERAADAFFQHVGQYQQGAGGPPTASESPPPTP
jgi:20S proteasome alpha/beta subunit